MGLILKRHLLSGERHPEFVRPQNIFRLAESGVHAFILKNGFPSKNLTCFLFYLFKKSVFDLQKATIDRGPTMEQ